MGWHGHLSWLLALFIFSPRTKGWQKASQCHPTRKLWQRNHNSSMRTFCLLALLTLVAGCSPKIVDPNAPESPDSAAATNVDKKPEVKGPPYVGEWRLAITADGKPATGMMTIMPDGSFEQNLQNSKSKVTLAGMVTGKELTTTGTRTVTVLDFVVNMVDGGEVPPSQPFQITYEKDFDTLTDSALAVWVRPDKLEATKAAQKK